MKLLIITQKVNKNDPILGFFHRWIIEFAKHVEKLTVICLEEGEHTLPENVRVLSLGKERGVGKLGRLARLYRYVWQYRNEYDSVFVHMNPIYVILCCDVWLVLRKKVFLWYTHKHVDWRLRIASWFVRTIFTASEESLRLKTKKKLVTGHGIDTDFFAPSADVPCEQGLVLTVGRVSQAKNVEVILRAIARVADLRLKIVGQAVTALDGEYVKMCKDLVRTLGIEDRVTWYGSVTHDALPSLYQQASLVVNMSTTGSLDKVILESVACGTPVITSNEAGSTVDGVCYIEHAENALVDALRQRELTKLDASVVNQVRIQHGLERLIIKLVSTMK